MSYTDGKTALNQMVYDLLTLQGLENDTQWENTEFNPTGRSPWASVKIINDTPRGVTMGKGGYDRMVGYVMVDYYVPSDTGTGVVDALITQARQQLPAGKSFVEGDTKVIITAVGAGDGSSVDNWYTRPLNIFYRTDLARASF